MGEKLKRGIDYFRAKAGTVYKMKYISVAINPASGPWITREFVGFGEHGKVRVDMATSGGTPEIMDFKFWRFPVYRETCVESTSKKQNRTAGLASLTERLMFHLNVWRTRKDFIHQDGKWVKSYLVAFENHDCLLDSPLEVV